MTPSPPDPRSACDRLISVFERALALDERGRLATDDSVHAPVLSFAISELRMRIGPALVPEGVAIDPFHVVLFGGTNTGKSTVLNVLIGRFGAEMGARARLSQHPAAYRPEALGDAWLDTFPSRFVRYQRTRNSLPARQPDEELRSVGYRPALGVFDLDRLAGEAIVPPSAASVVFWDAPDFSTEEARAYFSTVLDLAALADLVVMTVTDESYADDRGNTLLAMLADAGASVQVVANKVDESPALLDDIARTLGARGRILTPVLRLPFVSGRTPEERLARLLAMPESEALRAAIAREAGRGTKRKREALRSAVAFLQRRFDALMKPMADEADVAAAWEDVVERLTRDRLLGTYRRDYLEGLRYGEFDRALVQLMGLLQVPWIGPLLDLAGRVVRTPLRLAFEWIRGLMGLRVKAPVGPPENEVLDEAIRAWLAALRAEAQSLASTRANPVWPEIARRLDDEGFRKSLLERFNTAFDAYRIQIDDAVRRRAEAIYKKLEENPRQLTMLRGANLVGSALSVGLAIKTAGLDWSDAVIGPVVAGLWQNLLEWGMGRYLETQREGLKEEQFEALRAIVEQDLAEPARALFPGAVRAGDLAQARRDFGLVTETALRVAEGDGR